MKKFVPFLIGIFVASLVWLGVTTYMNRPTESVETEKPAGMDFIGTWHIESRQTHGNELSGENLKKVQEFGFDSFLTLNVDATAELNLYGNVFQGTWLAQGEHDAIISTDEIRKPMHLNDGKLVLGDQNDSFVFVRSTPEEYAAFLATDPAERAEEDLEEYWAFGDSWIENLNTDTATTEDDQPQEPEPEPQPNEWGIYPLDVVVADDELMTLKVTGKAIDHLGCSGYYLLITNNSDKPFTVTRALDSFTVNGVAATPVLSENLEPGQSIDVFMWWDAAEVKSLEELVNVDGIIEVDELNRFDAYATYPFKVN